MARLRKPIGRPSARKMMGPMRGLVRVKRFLPFGSVVISRVAGYSIRAMPTTARKGAKTLIYGLYVPFRRKDRYPRAVAAAPKRVKAKPINRLRVSGVIRKTSFQRELGKV